MTERGERDMTRQCERESLLRRWGSPGVPTAVGSMVTDAQQAKDAVKTLAAK